VKPLLIIDLEATCWKDNKKELSKLEYKNQEIIEIGAAILKIPNGVCLPSSSTTLISEFVRPVRNPILTDFCTELTSITQEQVDNAEYFPKALENFLNKVKKSLGDIDVVDVVFASWGRFDKSQFKRDCSLHDIEYPFGKHWNAKKGFSRSLGTKKGYGFKKALSKIGLEFEGNHHRGVDDANNMAKLIRVHFGQDWKDYV